MDEVYSLIIYGGRIRNFHFFEEYKGTKRLKGELFPFVSEEDYQGPLAKPARISHSNLVDVEERLSLPWGLDPLLNAELDGSSFAVRLEALGSILVKVYSFSKSVNDFRLESEFGLVNSRIDLRLNSEALAWKIEYSQL